MTIADVTRNALEGLLSEFAPQKFSKAINLASPTIANKVLKEEDVDGDDVLVYVYPDGMTSTAFVKDLGAMPRGVGIMPAEGKATPKPVVTVARLGRSAANARTPETKKAKMIDSHLSAAGRNAARQVCRGIFGGYVSPAAAAAFTGTGANATVTLDFDDLSLFRVGTAVDFADVSAGKSWVLRVKSVTPKAVTNSANVAGTVVLINDVVDIDGNAQTIDDAGVVTVATTDRFYPRGTLPGFGGAADPDGKALTSFDDLAGLGAEQDIYGISVAETGWRGQYLNLGVNWSQEAALGFLAQMSLYSDSLPNQVIMSPALAAAHAIAVGQHDDQVGGAARMTVDGSMDKYANTSNLKLQGRTITQDPNCQVDRAVLFNDDETKLYWWKRLGVLDDEGNGVRLLDDVYGLQVKYGAEAELVSQNRPSCGVIDGVTGL